MKGRAAEAVQAGLPVGTCTLPVPGPDKALFSGQVRNPWPENKASAHALMPQAFSTDLSHGHRSGLLRCTDTQPARDASAWDPVGTQAAKVTLQASRHPQPVCLRPSHYVPRAVRMHYALEDAILTKL